MGNPADLIRSRAGDTRVALRFEDASWTWDEYVRACAQRAAYLLDNLPDGKPPHVGVLIEEISHENAGSCRQPRPIRATLLDDWHVRR